MWASGVSSTRGRSVETVAVLVAVRLFRSGEYTETEDLT